MLKSDKKIKICPSCGSTEIILEPTTAMFAMQNYKCKKCGYNGTFFPEIDVTDIGKFQKDLKSK